MIFADPPENDAVLWWHKGTVTDITDGDTFKLKWSKGFSEYKETQKIRLAGIDTPDKERYVDGRGKNRIRTTPEREAAKEHLEKLIAIGDEVYFYSHKDDEDNWDRIVADVCTVKTRINLAVAQLEAGHAVLWNK